MNEGKTAFSFAKEIFPIYRSITGSGIRKTLGMIKESIDADDAFHLYEIPSGTQVFDWSVPEEWEISDAYIEDDKGNVILSFSDNCLHVVEYSEPIDKWVDLEELKSFIFTQVDQPDAIPYITSYYKKRVGFCMSEKQKSELAPGKYHMYINSSKKMGTMSFADCVFCGKSGKEILISTYCCHPSMANDNCSGIALSVELAKYVKGIRNRENTYRFVYVPETIGSIAYLCCSNHLEHLRTHCVAGFTLSCVGDDGDFSVINSKWADGLSDRVIDNVIKKKNIGNHKYKAYPYLERGSDERQYNSPGVDLSVVGFCRTKYWEFPEYHTSLDGIDCISEDGFQGSFDVMREVIDALENNKYYRTTVPCEPQLGKRGLYPDIGQKNTYADSTIVVDFLSYADGRHDLIEISNVINRPISQLIPLIKELEDQGLIQSD